MSLLSYTMLEPLPDQRYAVLTSKSLTGKANKFSVKQIFCFTKEDICFDLPQMLQKDHLFKNTFSEKYTMVFFNISYIGKLYSFLRGFFSPLFLLAFKHHWFEHQRFHPPPSVKDTLPSSRVFHPILTSNQGNQ